MTCTRCSSSYPGMSKAIKLKHLLTSPFTLHAGLVEEDQA